MTGAAKGRSAAVPGRRARTRKRSGRTVSVDWFEASVKEVDVDVVFALLAAHLGEVWGRVAAEVLREDEKGFDAKGPLGLRVRADRVGQPDLEGVRLPGEVCRAVGTDKVLDLAEALLALGDVKVSRVDVALDDFDKSFTPRKFAETCVDGDLDDEEALLGARVVTRVKPENWEWSRRKGGCFWLGSRTGARLLRVYDKDKESSGLIPSTRLELQSRDDFATTLVQRMLKARGKGRGIQGVFLAHLVEYVDLREPQGCRSSSQKWPRLPWWEAIVGDVRGIATPGRDDSGVWEWLGAIRRQFGGALCVLLRAAGVDDSNYVLGAVDEKTARKVVDAVRAILGSSLPELSADHQLRLEQLKGEEGRQKVRRSGLFPAAP